MSGVSSDQWGQVIFLSAILIYIVVGNRHWLFKGLNKRGRRYSDKDKQDIERRNKRRL